MTEKPKQKRGFAAMSPEKLRQISSMGGKATPAHKRTWFDRTKASTAGKVGGKAKRLKKL